MDEWGGWFKGELTNAGSKVINTGVGPTLAGEAVR